MHVNIVNTNSLQIMTEILIKPFLCESIDKSLLRSEWEKWLRAFQIYAESEDITNFKQKRTKLLYLGGTQLQSVAFSLPDALAEFNQDEPNDVFQILVDKLTTYSSPKQNSSFERHLFRNLIPSEDESFAKFVLRLRQQIQKCAFGSTKTEIDEICLKDKIIDSWATVDLKRKLLEKEQWLDEIIEACQVDEEIKKQSVSMTKPISESINKISTRKPGNQNNECGRCGRVGHKADSSTCPARQAKCNRCGRLGHFGSKCRTNLKRQHWQSRSGTQGEMAPTSSVRNVQDESGRNKKTKMENCFKIDSEGEEEWIRCRIGGAYLSLIINSGSR